MPGVLGLWGHSVDHLIHLLVAFVLALPIGWHRGREEQSEGLRTSQADLLKAILL
jgi:hypothetical protein